MLSSMRGGSSTGSATARSVADDIYTKRLAPCGIHGAADYSRNGLSSVGGAARWAKYSLNW